MSDPDDRTDSLVRKVQAMYAKAEGTTFEEERKTYLDKADKLVQEHMLQAALEDAARSKEEQETVSATMVDIFGADRGMDSMTWSNHVLNMLILSAKHNDVYPVYLGGGRVHLVGFKRDIDFAQMLFANLQIHFLRSLEPSYDQSLTFEHNVYNFKVAGVRWRAMAHICTMAGHPVPWTEKSQDGRRLIKAYKKYCADNDVEPTHQTQSHETYRESFADNYFGTLRYRLHDQRQDRTDSAVAQGAEVALRSRMDRVMDKVYEMFPHLHPDAVRKRQEEAAAFLRDNPAKPGRFRAPKAESEAAYLARVAGGSAGRDAAQRAKLTADGNTVNKNTQKGIG